MAHPLGFRDRRIVWIGDYSEWMGEELVSGLLPAKGQVLLVGEKGIGKSTLALEICHSLLTQEPLWGALIPNKKLERILFLHGEHYKETLQDNYLHRMGLPPHHGLSIVDKAEWNHHVVVNAVRQDEPILEVTKWLRETQPELVVWDPLASFVRGPDIENDNNQMRYALDTISELCIRNGASCLILAHPGKPGMDQHGREHSRRTYMTRGASAIEDAATNIWYLKHGEKKVEYVLERREYKGKAPDSYRLIRDEQTSLHRYLPEGKHVEKDEWKAKYEGAMGRLLLTENGLSRADARRIVCKVLEIKEERAMTWEKEERRKEHVH